MERRASLLKVWLEGYRRPSLCSMRRRREGKYILSFFVSHDVMLIGCLSAFCVGVGWWLCNSHNRQYKNSRSNPVALAKPRGKTSGGENSLMVKTTKLIVHFDSLSPLLSFIIIHNLKSDLFTRFILRSINSFRPIGNIFSVVNNFCLPCVSQPPAFRFLLFSPWISLRKEGRPTSASPWARL